MQVSSSATLQSVAGRSAEKKAADPAERLAPLRAHAAAMIDELQRLSAAGPEERQPAWSEQIAMVQDVLHFAESVSAGAKPRAQQAPASHRQLVAFGLLLRDKRNAAGFSRVQLARKAKLSDATIKFLETGKHPPSRATLIRLIGVAELKLTWADAPGQHRPPVDDRAEELEASEVLGELNCFITPNYDSVRMVMDLGKFLNGAGGHVEQTNAYLDHQSAAAYMAMCQQSAVASSIRASTPLAAAAQRIVGETGASGLNVVALGAGDATLEVRLVQHLLEDASAPNIELCLLDISQPLLNSAYRHALDTLGERPNVSVWAMQCNFHHLPLHTQLFYMPARLRRRRVFCMLGGTLANLDDEPRFFEHSLLCCSPGDLLLLDMQVARGSTDNPEEIQRRDKTLAAGVAPAHATWLAGPIWRHCKDVLQVDFNWRLQTQCPVPGSYALDAVATVQSRGRADRNFSVFRFRRYDPDKLAECLAGLGWDQVWGAPFGGVEQPACLRLFCKRSSP